MRARNYLNPSILSVLALLLILAGSVATSNGATSTSEPPEVTIADGIVTSPGTPQGTAGARGPAGPRGKRGPRGTRGKTGARGRTGARGPVGAGGALGPTGAAGVQGAPGAIGVPGVAGAQGVPGPAGATGATGPIASGEFAQFFAIMPPDNAATVAIGAAVDFPQDGPISGAISRLGADSFNLPSIGTYRVAFTVPVTEAGQLVLSLNGSELAYTVVGRATGTSAITGESLITTTVVNSIIEVVNPASNPAALTITPLAGGASPVSASIIIQQLL